MEHDTHLPSERKRTINGVEWIVSIIVILLLSLIALPNFLEPFAEREKHKQFDMRSMATAIESYYVDHQRYPDATLNVQANAFASIPDFQSSSTFQIPTFRTATDTGESVIHLTSPLAYMAKYNADPFAPNPGMTFGYWPGYVTINGKPDFFGWILWSPGPDGDYDLTMQNVEQAYNPDEPVPSKLLLSFTFDPTNGSDSNGDIYRTKQ